MRFDIGLQLKLMLRITWSNTCFIRLKNDSSSLQTVVGCNRAIGTFADAFDRASTSTSSWVDMSACAFVLSRIALVAIIIGTVAATAATIRRCGRISQRSATDGTSRTRAAFATEYLLVSLSMSTSTSTSMKTNMLRAGRHSFLLHDKRSCLRKHLSWLVMGRGRSRWMLQPQLPLLQLGIRSAAMRRLWVILRKSQHSIPSISDDAPSLQIQATAFSASNVLTLRKESTGREVLAVELVTCVLREVWVLCVWKEAVRVVEGKPSKSVKEA